MIHSNLVGYSALVLDDFQTIRESLRIQLANIGITDVKLAPGVVDAIRFVRERTFKILLVDYNLGSERTGQHFLEEIRMNGLISHEVIVVMVTAERGYENVMAIVEHIPDDYLIKPCSAEQLYKSITKAASKKQDLSRIYQALDGKEYTQAIFLCDDYLKNQEAKNRLYVERIRAETYLHSGDFEKAAEYYQSILSEQSRPWAEVGLGKACYHLGDFAKAKRLFEHVAETNPGYVDSLDSLAKAHIATGELTKAQQTIQRAVNKSPGNVKRQLDLGKVAMKNNDTEVAQQALEKAIQRSPGSCSRTPEAHILLAQLEASRGNIKKASDILSQMNKDFNASDVTRFASFMVMIDLYRKDGKTEEMEKCFSEAHKIYAAQPNNDYPDSVRHHFLCECFSYGKEALGEQMLRNEYRSSKHKKILVEDILRAAFVNSTKVTIMALIEDIEDEIRKEKEALEQETKMAFEICLALAKEGKWKEALEVVEQVVEKSLQNPTGLLNSTQIILMCLEKTGMDENIFQKAETYFSLAKRLDKTHPKISMIEMLMNRVMKQYGIQKKKHSSAHTS